MAAASERTEVDRCPVCGDGARTPWLWALGFELCRCKGCGHRYSTEVLATHRLSHAYYEEPDDDLAARGLAAKRARFEEYVRAFPAVFQRPGRVLDIGCNAGELLSLFRERGWQVEGVEMSPGPAAYARRRLGAPIHTGLFEEYRPEERFDLVTMTHVLEHLSRPVDALRRIAELVVPGGGVLCEVPNATDAVLPLFGGFYRPLCPGDHLSFFDEPSLRRALGDAGFQGHEVVSPLHSRDVFYGAMFSALDFARTRGGARLAGGGGVESQTRYRGRLRRPLKRLLDVAVEAVDPLVGWAHGRGRASSGAVLIAHATTPADAA